MRNVLITIIPEVWKFWKSTKIANPKILKLYSLQGQDRTPLIFSVFSAIIGLIVGKYHEGHVTNK